MDIDEEVVIVQSHATSKDGVKDSVKDKALKIKRRPGSAEKVFILSPFSLSLPSVFSC